MAPEQWLGLPLDRRTDEYALGGTLHALLAGSMPFFAESLDTFVQDLRRARPTLFLSVPRLWQRFQSGVFSKMAPGRLRLLLKIPIVKGRVKKKILDDAEGRRALWARLQFSLDGEPDPWFDFDKAAVDTRQFTPLEVL